MIKVFCRCGVRALARSAVLMFFAIGCDGAIRSASDIPLVATTEEVFTLGGAEVPDWQAFVEVSEVHFDGAGNLVVVDRRQPRIAVADPEGGFRHFISRAGDGPGELRLVVDAQVLRDDRLVVIDGGHAAMLLFDSNGEFLDQFSVDNRSPTIPLPGQTSRFLMAGSNSHPVFLGALPDDRWLAKRADTRTLEIHTLGQGTVEIYRAYEPPVSTTTPLGGGIDLRTSNLEVSLPAGLFPRMLAFGPPLAAGVLTDGRIAVVDSTGYKVRILQDDGTVDAVLERPIEPVPVTPEMREAARQRQMGGGGTKVSFIGLDMSGQEADAAAKTATESLASLMEFASEVPVIDGIAVDREDRIWVSRTGGDGVSNGPIDVFTAEGDYFGTLAADAFRIPDAFGPAGLMAYIELDELDVATVRVLRLVSLQPAAAG